MYTKRYNIIDDFSHMVFNKSALAHGGLFLCLAALVFMLFSQGHTHPLDFAVIYICLIISIALQSYLYSNSLKQECKKIILPWIVMAAVIAGEIGLIICGEYNSSRQYALFVHLTLKIVGLAAAVICFSCLAVKKHPKINREDVFIPSFMVLTSSVCILSMLHEPSLDKTFELWWEKYALMEAGIIAIGTLGSMFSSLWQRHNS